jgi:hypothetical protein
MSSYSVIAVMALFFVMGQTAAFLDSHFEGDTIYIYRFESVF